MLGGYDVQRVCVQRVIKQSVNIRTIPLRVEAKIPRELVESGCIDAYRFAKERLAKQLAEAFMEEKCLSFSVSEENVFGYVSFRAEIDIADPNDVAKIMWR